MVHERLSNDEQILFSHQHMEYLMENSDSVTVSDNKLCFYRQGVNSETITIHPTGFVLESGENTDTLFSNYLDFDFIHALNEENLIDSLIISTIVNNDTVLLEYGLYSDRDAILNEEFNYEDKR